MVRFLHDRKQLYYTSCWLVMYKMPKKILMMSINHNLHSRHSSGWHLHIIAHFLRFSYMCSAIGCLDYWKFCNPNIIIRFLNTCENFDFLKRVEQSANLNDLTLLESRKVHLTMKTVVFLSVQVKLYFLKDNFGRHYIFVKCTLIRTLLGKVPSTYNLFITSLLYVVF